MYSVSMNAQDTTKIEKKVKTKEELANDSIANRSSMAIQIAIEGIQSQSPIMLINAALISKSLNIKTSPQDTSKGQKYDAYSLLVTAEKMCKDKNLTNYIKTLIKEVKAEEAIAGKGRSAGPVSTSGYDYFEAGKGYSVYVPFTGGYGNVNFVGTGSSDFDLYIYDENNNLITKDEDYSAYCICAFNLYYSQTIRIKFVSRSSGYFNYVITTN